MSEGEREKKREYCQRVRDVKWKHKKSAFRCVCVCFWVCLSPTAVEFLSSPLMRVSASLWFCPLSSVTLYLLIWCRVCVYVHVRSRVYWHLCLCICAPATIACQRDPFSSSLRQGGFALLEIYSNKNALNLKKGQLVSLCKYRTALWEDVAVNI